MGFSRRQFLFVGAAWPLVAMADNCYWVEELGAVELCTGADLPPLADGWVRFDSEPDPIAGRSFYTTFYGESRAPMAARPAFGNGKIVVAAGFSYGVTGNGSNETYAVFVSDDDGFTYGDCIEKFTWLPGAGTYYGGYDACPYWRGVDEQFGTFITFDGSLFYVVSNTSNDDSDNVQRIVTSRSADGETWTTENVVGANHTVTHTDSIDGDLYYLGTNHVDAVVDFSETGRYTAGYSDDHGATWTTHVFTEAEHNYGGQPTDRFESCSADAVGLHIAYLGYIDDPYFYGILYHRPTSKTTWAAPSMVYDVDTEGPSYFLIEEGCIEVLASRSRPGEVYLGFALTGDSDALAWRRSTDGGATFSSLIYAWIGSVALSEYFDFIQSQNKQVAVELDDGRIVIVFVVSSYNSDTFESFVTVTYVVSEDGMQTFSAPVAVSVNEWISDSSFRAERIRACAKGNDVVVTQTRRNTAGNNLIFRP